MGVVALCLVAVGVAAAAILLPQPVPAGLDESTTPVTAAVVTSDYDGAHAVAATPRVHTATTLNARQDGTVTATSCAPGVPLESGQTVVAVDGTALLGLATSEPLWRDLSSGASGSDVRALQSELERLGYPVTVDGKYGGATQNAVRKLLGLSAAQSADLPLARVVWLPSAQVVPQECPVQLGDVIDAGSEVATLAGSLVSLQLAEQVDPQNWVVTYQGVRAAVGEAGVVTDPALLAAVETSEAFVAQRDSGSAGVIEVTVTRTELVTVAAVPPSGVKVTQEGQGCVAVGSKAIGVQIVGSSLGQALVSFGESNIPDSVQVTYPQGLACP